MTRLIASLGTLVMVGLGILIPSPAGFITRVPTAVPTYAYAGHDPAAVPTYHRGCCTDL